MNTDEITGQILEVAIDLHRDLGPGLLESVYEALLAHGLRSRGLRVRRQQPVQLERDGIVFPEAFRVDLLVENTVIIELKSAAKNDPVFDRQLLTYLRLMRLPVGLVLNFGRPTMLEGAKRLVNMVQPQSSSRVRVNAKFQPASEGAEPTASPAIPA